MKDVIILGSFGFAIGMIILLPVLFFLGLSPNIGTLIGGMIGAYGTSYLTWRKHNGT